MVERLTEDEMRRIQNFARTPAYAREPEQLLPEDAEPESADGDDDGRDEEQLASAVPNGGRHR